MIEVPTVGRLQMMKDPQGAAFYIIQPSSQEERLEGAPEVGEGSWHELMTTDAPAAMQFYSEVFGWQAGETMDMGPMGKYHMFNRPHGMIGGMMNKPPEMAQVPPHWAIYFRVPEINAAIERITASGGQIVNGPMEVPGGDWVVNAMDPQGAAFSLHAKKPNKSPIDSVSLPPARGCRSGCPRPSLPRPRRTAHDQRLVAVAVRHERDDVARARGGAHRAGRRHRPRASR